MEETRSREKTWGGREKPPQAGLPGRVPLGGDTKQSPNDEMGPPTTNGF